MADENDITVEQEARSMGWLPQEDFPGDPEKWVDAEEFVERGRHVMPILLANNKRLQRELSTRDNQIGTLKAELKNATTAIEKLEKHYTEANKRAVENAKAQLRAELKQAREDNDVDAELDIQERLREVDKALEDAPKNPPEKKEKPQDSGLSTEFISWQKDNPWFGEDKKKTKLVTRIAEDLREEGSDLEGRAFMDRCVELYEEQYGNSQSNSRAATSKVEGVSNRGSSRSSGKTFADLPKEAKEACWADIDDLVGEGKRYKTQKDWENAYAKIYFTE